MRIKFITAVFLGACSYGVLSTLVKLAYENGVPTAVVTSSQFLIGWFLLATLLAFTQKKRRLTMKEKIQLMLAGIPTGLVGIFYYLSLVTIEASVAIILLFQFVWIGVVLESLINRQFPTKKTVGSLIILLIGTVLASGSPWFNQGTVHWLGVLFGLLAAVSFALFILANAKVLPQLPTVQRSYYMVSGSLMAVLFIFGPQLFYQPLTTYGQLGWYGVLLGFFGVCIPPLLFAYGMPQIGSGLGSILSSIELPVAVLLSVIVLKETVILSKWIGVFFIFLAIILPNIEWKKEQLAKNPL
ncbi:DMT family transporter [Halalkalibacterium halodurans]|uniref:EamA family transporter n=1 Tax=Halalkalibacterium halodurans TaxID=86665 RepID=UPI002E242F9C|nr:DMT family transporter [Halalkalibacterium halodurans]MED4171094.1 DMT family transporter [Halalkalibacterium halodurans]